MRNAPAAKPASLSDDHTRAFCAKLVPGGVPISITPTPPAHAALNDCVNLVDAAVRHAGGDRVDGWAVWERPGILIEGEYHCVWRTPAGELRDLAPLPDGVSARLFLADPHLAYEGRQINNVRHALNGHASVQRLIAAYDAHFAMLNRGERAHQHGAVHVPREEQEPVLLEILAAEREVAARLGRGSRKVGRNEPCPCGSGTKYKRCHGR